MKAKPTRTKNLGKEEVIAEATKTPDQEMKNYTFRIPVQVHRDFKTKTASENKKMSDVLEELLGKYIKQ